LGRGKKKGTVAQYDELFGHFPGRTEENFEELSKYSQCPVSKVPVYVCMHT
jgi:hypothetical protein